MIFQQRMRCGPVYVQLASCSRMCSSGTIDLQQPLLLLLAGSPPAQGGPYRCQLLGDQEADLNGKAVVSTVKL